MCARYVEPKSLRNKDTFDNNDFVLEDSEYDPSDGRVNIDTKPPLLSKTSLVA